MSFSKAKLKRFNEINVTDSPFCDRAERKETIKKFLKEQAAKDAAAIAVETESAKKCSTETKSKSLGLRLFRTPSLPRRLRFNRQPSSDLLGSEKKCTAKDLFEYKEKKDKEALDAAYIEIKNKTDVLLEFEQQLEDLKQSNHELHKLKIEQCDKLHRQENEIDQLKREINETNRANEFLQQISERSIEKINQLENDVKLIMKNHNNEIDFLIGYNTDGQIKFNILQKDLNKSIAKNKTIKNELNNTIIELNALNATCITIVEQLETQKSINKQLSSENEQIKRQSLDDNLYYVDEIQKLTKEIVDLKCEKDKISQNLTNLQQLQKTLQDEITNKDIEMDLEREESEKLHVKKLKNFQKKFEQKIHNLNNENQQKLQEYKQTFDFEKLKLIENHREAIETLKTQNTIEMKRLCEINDEKIRISEIQNEQKYKALEASIDQAISTEKTNWKLEIDKCQKIAENEIIQSEFEKHDLKILLSSFDELIKEKDNRITQLESKLNTEQLLYRQTNEELTENLETQKLECERILSEKFTYQLTLNNTRSTLDILMKRLKKSDGDVELLKKDLESMLVSKSEIELDNRKLTDEITQIKLELHDYRNALVTLKNSSMTLEREIKEKESVFEKLMTCEEETIETVNRIGKLLNNKLDESIDKYFEMYNDVKLKYESRESYIQDMKTILDEFATGIELARLELDTKDKQINDLENENKNLQFDIMTLKFKCEQFEKYEMETPRVPNSSPDISVVQHPHQQSDEETMVSNFLIDNIIKQLEKEANQATSTTVVVSTTVPTVMNTVQVNNSVETYCDEEKINEENRFLKEKLIEKCKQLDVLQEMIDLESLHVIENIELKKKLEYLEQKIQPIEGIGTNIDNDELKLSKVKHVRNSKTSDEISQGKKLAQRKLVLNSVKDIELHESKNSKLDVTPRKNHLTSVNKLVVTTPKTPKTPKTPLPSCDKENNSPVSINCAGVSILSPKPLALRIRNN